MAGRAGIARVWICFGFVALAGAGVRILQQVNPASPLIQPWRSSVHLLDLIPYALALYFSLKIWSDHRNSTMRLAWLLIAASSAMELVRHSFEWTGFAAGWHQSMPTTLLSLRQIPIVMALVLLMTGLTVMWSSFTAIGFGLHFRRIDVALLLLVFAFVPMIFWHRQSMADSQSAYPLIRYLQSASPLLLAAPAVVGLVLHRISQEMGGGQWALSLRYMVAFLVARLAALMIGLVPALAGISALSFLGTAISWSAPWLFVLAVLHRWHLTQSASELASRYETNPEGEIAELSQALTVANSQLPRTSEN